MKAAGSGPAAPPTSADPPDTAQPCPECPAWWSLVKPAYSCIIIRPQNHKLEAVGHLALWERQGDASHAALSGWLNKRTDVCIST